MATNSKQIRYKGHVKFFNSTKGYGFILPNSIKGEVFVHHTDIRNNGGFKSLAEGEEVEYDLVQGPKGMQASNVTGPNGSSVQGNPRIYRQSYSRHYDTNRVPYYEGYIIDPCFTQYAYTVQQYPSFIQPIYPGQPYLPYRYIQSQETLLIQHPGYPTLQQQQTLITPPNNNSEPSLQSQ